MLSNVIAGSLWPTKCVARPSSCGFGSDSQFTAAAELNICQVAIPIGSQILKNTSYFLRKIQMSFTITAGILSYNN